MQREEHVPGARRARTYLVAIRKAFYFPLFFHNFPSISIHALTVVASNCESSVQQQQQQRFAASVLPHRGCRVLRCISSDTPSRNILPPSSTYLFNQPSCSHGREIAAVVHHKPQRL
jgi:hypothetical protein